MADVARPPCSKSVYRGSSPEDCSRQEYVDEPKAAAAGYTRVEQWWGTDNNAVVLTILFRHDGSPPLSKSIVRSRSPADCLRRAAADEWRLRALGYGPLESWWSTEGKSAISTILYARSMPEPRCPVCGAAALDQTMVPSDEFMSGGVDAIAAAAVIVDGDGGPDRAWSVQVASRCRRCGYEGQSR